jgi:hypothetical protein
VTEGAHVRVRPLWIRIIKNVVLVIASLVAILVLFAAMMLGFVWLGLKLIE